MTGDDMTSCVSFSFFFFNPSDPGRATLVEREPNHDHLLKSFPSPF